MWHCRNNPILVVILQWMLAHTSRRCDLSTFWGRRGIWSPAKALCILLSHEQVWGWFCHWIDGESWMLIVLYPCYASFSGLLNLLLSIRTLTFMGFFLLWIIQLSWMVDLTLFPSYVNQQSVISYFCSVFSHEQEGEHQAPQKWQHLSTVSGLLFLHYLLQALRVTQKWESQQRDSVIQLSERDEFEQFSTYIFWCGTVLFEIVQSPGQICRAGSPRKV